MKQVININYHGRIVPIEQTAYELLKDYIESLHRYFSAEIGKEEIINDIESRIGELFEERLKAGAVCITDIDVNAVITSMGRPEEFDLREEEASDQEKKSTGEKTTGGGKKLSRNEQQKIIGGVCAGLADYFNVDVTIVRLFFVVMFFSFGFGLIPYIVLWIVVPHSSKGQIGAVRKKLYRDVEHKLIGGVCAGVSEFFGIDVWIPRVLFLLPLIGTVIGRMGHWDHIENSFLPGAIIAYIICWIILPEAVTTSEKLQMKGEKIDMNTIKNTINEEMRGVGERMKKVGEEIKQETTKKSNGFFAELGAFVARVIRGMVKVIIFFVKLMVYTTLVTIGLGLLVALLGLLFGTITVFPLKDYLLNGFWQNMFAIGTLLFFVVLFIVASIVLLIKKVAGIKSKNKWLTGSFIVLWVLGWICLFGLISTLGKEFSTMSHRDKNEKEIQIVQPVNDKLIVHINPGPYSDDDENEGVVFFGIPVDMFKDSIFINNVKVKILRSTDSAFHVRFVYSAHGSTRNAADTTVSLIKYNISQKDSVISLEEGFYITPKTKFRNQQIAVLISVPEGKRVRLEKYHSSKHISSIWEVDGVMYDELPDEDLEMTTGGLTYARGIKNKTNENKEPSKKDKELDSLIRMKQKIEEEIQKKSATQNQK